MPFTSSRTRPTVTPRDFCSGPAVNTRQGSQEYIPSGPPREAHIVFKGKYYSSAVLYAIGRTGVRIMVKPQEWHEDKNLVDFSHSGELDESGSLVVVQYEGKYVPVTGIKSHQASMLKGEALAYLLSNVSLKKSYLHDAN